jgi:hypothetical protein
MIETKWHAKPLYLLIALVLSLGIMAVPSNILADGEVTFFSEDFEGGLPGNWTVVDNGCNCTRSPGYCCPNWTHTDPCGLGAGCNCSGIFMLADSNCCWPEPPMDTELWTPSIDCSGYDTVRLEFDHDLYIWPDEWGEVDISNDGGTNWTNIYAETYTGTPPCGRASMDISPQAAGQSDVRIRWRFQAELDSWWKVDNVQLCGTPPVPVGGEAYPIDRTSILAPWIAMAVLLAGGASWYALRRRRAQN